MSTEFLLMRTDAYILFLGYQLFGVLLCLCFSGVHVCILIYLRPWISFEPFVCANQIKHSHTHSGLCSFFLHTSKINIDVSGAQLVFIRVFFLIKWEKRRKKEKRTKVKTESILFCSLSRLVCPYEVNSRRNETKIQSNNKITTADRVI